MIHIRGPVFTHSHIGSGWSRAFTHLMGREVWSWRLDQVVSYSRLMFAPSVTLPASDVRLVALPASDVRLETASHEALFDQTASGALCAVLAGDTRMLARLIWRRADINHRVSGLSELGFYDSQTLLMVAAKSHQKPEVLSTLLELRADVNARDRSGLNCAFYVRSALHVQVLVEAKADLHSTCVPLGLAPLTGASSSADTDTVAAMLEALCDPNPELSGAGYGPLHGVAGFARHCNRYSAKTARLLLAWRADIDMRARPSGKYQVLTLAARARTGLGQASGSLTTRRVAALPGITPLAIAAMLGDGELTQLFLEFGAEMLANDRGDLPATCPHLGKHGLNLRCPKKRPENVGLSFDRKIWRPAMDRTTWSQFLLRFAFECLCKKRGAAQA